MSNHSLVRVSGRNTDVYEVYMYPKIMCKDSQWVSIRFDKKNRISPVVVNQNNAQYPRGYVVYDYHVLPIGIKISERRLLAEMIRPALNIRVRRN